MIFNVPGHIELIRNGLHMELAEEKAGIRMAVVKTQTRRLNRGIYKVGKDYAVQRKRGAKGEEDIRIVIDRIWEEKRISYVIPTLTRYFDYYIRAEDAWAEGGYTVEEYEKLFRELNPKWDSWSRWAFEFHVVNISIKEEVRK